MNYACLASERSLKRTHKGGTYTKPRGFDDESRRMGGCHETSTYRKEERRGGRHDMGQPGALSPFDQRHMLLQKG